MNKKVTSLLLAFVMVFSMVATAVPSRAASSNEFVIVPDKTEAAPGDTVTYSVVIGPIENFQSANFTLIIPEGLTFVSGAVAEGLAELTGATEAGFENSTLTFYHGGLEAYTCDHDTELMTFTCTVNADAIGEYEIQIMDDYDFADNAWTSYDMIINTAASKITVAEKSIPATGIVLNKETLSLKVGESETLVATLTPVDTTDVLAWTSSDNAIATVDANGNISAIAEGTATITAQAGDVSATCVVTVECAHTNTTEHPAKESTCTEQGNDAYTTCDDCGDVIEGSAEKLPIDPDNHVDITTVPADAGTCINPGHAEYSFCNDCESIISGSDSPVVGPHGNYVEKAEEEYLKTEADCESAAVYYKSCELCGETHATETFTYGDPLGHSFTNYVSNNDATCTEDGTKTAKCDRCDEISIVTDEGSALGHDWVDADCTTPKTCNRCGETEGEALGHSYSTEWSKGEDGHWHECSVCGDKTDLADHDYGDGDKCVACEYERAHIHRLTLVPAVDATCTTDGNVAYYTCSGCENWFEDASGSIVIADKTSVVIAALGHDLTDATCTEAAYCKREGCEYTEGEALGHSFTNYVSNNDATCTEDGTKTAKCDRCDETSTVTDEGSALGHDWVDADCTTPKSCDRCGETEGEALGHNYSTEWSKGEDGHWHECSVCGDKTDLADHDYGDGDKCVACEYERAHIHRLTLVPAVDATCTTDGNVAYYTCSGCENWFEDASGSIVIADKTAVVIAALGHDLTDATCTEAAYCKREGCEYTEGEALGHDWVDADCTAPKTCDRCGETEGDALGHNFQDGVCTECGEEENVEDPSEPSTPVNPGWGSWFEKWFGHWWGDEEECDHSYVSTVVDPTCTEKGYTKHTCELCDDSYKDNYVAATGHNYENNVCTECGHKSNKKPFWGGWFDWFWKR